MERSGFLTNHWTINVRKTPAASGTGRPPRASAEPVEACRTKRTIMASGRKLPTTPTQRCLRSWNRRSHFFNHLPSEFQDCFYPSSFTHIYHVGQQVFIFYYKNFTLTCFCLSVLTTLNGFLPVIRSPSPLTSDLQLNTTFSFPLFKLTALTWCPFCGLVQELWL